MEGNKEASAIVQSLTKYKYLCLQVIQGKDKGQSEFKPLRRTFIYHHFVVRRVVL